MSFQIWLISWYGAAEINGVSKLHGEVQILQLNT